MPNYRRIYIPGGTYFFTVVTYQRKPFLTMDCARKCLRNAFLQTQYKYPFDLQAICLLPDHLHSVWTLPEAESDYSIRWRYLKAVFSRLFREQGGYEGSLSTSRGKRREVGYWQRRFWEHTISNENEMEKIIEYIHYNPVKHGYVDDPAKWKWSSFQRYFPESPRGDWKTDKVFLLKDFGE